LALQSPATTPGKGALVNNNLNIYRGSKGIWHGAQFDTENDLPARAQNSWIGAEKNQTEQDKAREASHVLLNRTANSAIVAALAGHLGNTVGFLGRGVGIIKGMTGKNPAESTKLIQEAQEGFAQFQKSISGTAVSEAESNRLSDVVAMKADNENTFLQKVIASTLRAAETTWAERAGLSKTDRQTLFSHSSVLGHSLNLEKKAFQHLEAAKMAKRNNQATYKIPGDYYPYKTAIAEATVSDMVTNSSKYMTKMARELLPDSPNVPPATAFREKGGK
tara:strand:- start:18 stop:848 length:831 start_codon:yes stop_codon:yes gene_type:complete